jgi:hypothetical protein
MQLGDESNNTSMPPTDVYIEVVIGFLFTLAGIVMPLKFRAVHKTASTTNKRWEEAFGRPDYFAFSPRLRELNKRRKYAKRVVKK